MLRLCGWENKERGGIPRRPKRVFTINFFGTILLFSRTIVFLRWSWDECFVPVFHSIMRRLFPIFLAFTLLTCSLASLRVIRCVEMSCGSGSRLECSAVKECTAEKQCAAQKACTAGKACAATLAQEGDGQQDPDDGVPCCFVCSPNCCCCLPPTVGFQLRSFPEELLEKPQGQQHRFAQLFHCSVWHPPAPEV